MAVSEVQICNMALTKIGVDRIISLDDAIKQAELCKESYPVIRDEFLGSHPWNFSITRTSLAAESTAPTWGFSKQFPLPADCLRVLEVDTDFDWVREGNKILTDEPVLYIKYIKKEVDVSKYNPTFSEALSCHLAAHLCYSLVQSTTLREQLLAEAKAKSQTARSFDAQEGTPQKVKADYWSRQRF